MKIKLPKSTLSPRVQISKSSFVAQCTLNPKLGAIIFKLTQSKDADEAYLKLAQNRIIEKVKSA